MHTFGRIVSTATLLGCATLFVATLQPAVRVPRQFAILFLATFISWGATGFALWRRKQALRRQSPRPTDEQLERQFWATFPPAFWRAALLGVAAGFAALMSFNERFDGVATTQDGSFFLQSHGRIVRELNEEEYWHVSAVEIRGVVGICLIFNSISTAFFWLGTRRSREEGHATLARP